MFIAMNRFRVRKGDEAEFEERWQQREIHIRTVPGFVEFHLLKGPEREARRRCLSKRRKASAASA